MKSGYHYHYRKLEFWAERGLINVVDERFPPNHPKAHTIITVGTWLRRLKFLSDELKTPFFMDYPDEREELQTMIENGIACAKDAKNQGRPDDPKAVADIMKQRERIIFVGQGQQDILHTASADSVPEGSLLPPIPTREKYSQPVKKLIIP